MKRRRALAVASSFGLFVVLANGCKPKEGASCSNTQAVCTSKDEGLFCEKPSAGSYGKYRRYHCGGAKGCYKDATMIRCDQGVASAGQACDSKDNGAACALDKKSTLKCSAAPGVFAVELQCRGPKGCDVGAKGVECDRSIAEAGDTCQKKDEGTSACSVDGKSRLDCVLGKYVLAAECEGPKHCVDVGDAIDCDAPAMHKGARCKQEGAAACSTDHKAMLHCKDGTYGDAYACLGAGACEVRGDDVFCDQSITDDGAPCNTEKQESCGTDGKTVLTCKSGKFVKTRACPKACKLGQAAKGYVPPARCTG